MNVNEEKHPKPLLSELMDMGHEDCDICTYSRGVVALGRSLCHTLEEGYHNGAEFTDEPMRELGLAYLKLTEGHGESSDYRERVARIVE